MRKKGIGLVGFRCMLVVEDLKDIGERIFIWLFRVYKGFFVK